jgi:sulfonate transport system substrate-binding protein
MKLAQAAAELAAEESFMRRTILFVIVLLWPCGAFGQALPKARMAYTSINIQMTPIYMMKDLDLARKHGLDTEVLMIPVSSRAIQAALAGEIQFMTSGGVANINANMSGGDFVGITSTISTFVFKIIGQPGIKEPSQLKGKKVAISRLGGASDFSLRFGLDRWGLVPEKDVAIIQIGGEAEALLALQNRAVDAATISEPFTTIAQREGFSVVSDLSRLNVPYTLHGIGTRKSIIRERRDVVVRFMRAYVEAIYLFKTKKDLALGTLKKYARMSDISLMNSTYDDYSQRLIPAVPYPIAPGIQTIIDHLAKTRPEAKGLKPQDFIDASILREIEDSGFVKKLYAN